MKSGAPFLKRSEPLRIGFLPVSDCAPLVYAQEGGIFAKYDLDVELSREIRWGDLRDKVIQGGLEAAHAPAPLPFLANLGIDSDYCACVSGLVMSLQGSAITLSRQLWDEGVRDAGALRQKIYEHWGRKTYTFGFPHNFSSQYHLLQKWLKSAGIAPEREVRLVMMPPTQMFPSLKLGYLDGYCVSEPWSSVAMDANFGMCVATSAELAPLHPEKVLMVRQSFSIGRSEQHERLIAALVEACAFCDVPKNRPLLADMMAHRQYVDAPAECLQGGLACSFKAQRPRAPGAAGFEVFHQHQANDPTDEKAAWIMDLLYELMAQPSPEQRYERRPPVLKNIFQRDIFLRARALLPSPSSRLEPVFATAAVA